MSDEQKKTVTDFNFTVPARCSYADIIQPRAFIKNGKPKGDPKYSVTMILPLDHPDLKRLQAAVGAMARENKPDKKFVIRPLTQEELAAGDVVQLAVPWKSGDVEAERMKAAGKNGEMFRGMTLVKGSSDEAHAPILEVIEKGALVPYHDPSVRAAAAKFFYSGCHILPGFGLHWYKGDTGKPDGVALYFNVAVACPHLKGERLGGRAANTAEAFKGYLGTLTAEDPTGGEQLDDEIAF